MLARQKARAVGKVTAGLLLNDLSEEDLRVINILPDATVKRCMRELYFPGGNGLVKKIEGTYPESLLRFHEGWVEFYKNFDIVIDLNDFPLPPYERLILEEGKEYWSIVAPEGMNPQKAFEIRKKISTVYEATPVSKIIDVYPRIKVSVIRAEQNAMGLNSNVSLNKSMELGFMGTTFTEGCIIDGRVLKDLSIHLDVNGATLHTGSRNEGGYVVDSYWCSDEFRVYWCDPYGSYPDLSLRQKQF